MRQRLPIRRAVCRPLAEWSPSAKLDSLVMDPSNEHDETIVHKGKGEGSFGGAEWKGRDAKSDARYLFVIISVAGWKLCWAICTRLVSLGLEKKVYNIVSLNEKVYRPGGSGNGVGEVEYLTRVLLVAQEFEIESEEWRSPVIVIECACSRPVGIELQASLAL